MLTVNGRKVGEIMRLIDADALADALFYKRKNYPQWVADTIGNMPDAVVRCKDCKHYHTGFNCDLLQKPIMTGDDWFCADGERGTCDV